MSQPMLGRKFILERSGDRERSPDLYSRSNSAPPKKTGPVGRATTNSFRKREIIGKILEFLAQMGENTFHPVSFAGKSDGCNRKIV